MFQNVLRRLASKTSSIRVTGNVPLLRSVAPLPATTSRHFTDAKDDVRQPFDISLLEFLVCPLSKKQLRYEEKTDELINDELGIAYPIIGGIPNMIPQDARLIQKHPAAAPAEPTHD